MFLEAEPDWRVADYLQIQHNLRLSSDLDWETLNGPVLLYHLIGPVRVTLVGSSWAILRSALTRSSAGCLAL